MASLTETTDGRLRSAAAECPWPEYREFARLQVAGLRPRALAAARDLANELRRQPLADRWRFTCWLFDQMLVPFVIAQRVLPFPLRAEVVVPTLLEMRAAEPSDPRPSCWLAMRFEVDLAERFPGGEPNARSILRDQLRRTPGDALARRVLSNLLLRHMDDAMHHLFESRYLGDPAADVAVVDELRELITDPSDPRQAEVDEIAASLNAWMDYLASEGGCDFPTWCERHGLTRPTGAAYYYDERRRVRPREKDRP